MFVVCVTFGVKQGAMDQFMPLMLAQAKNSLTREPECFRFDVCSGGSSDNEVFLYEIYASKAAFQAHLASEHFIEFDAAVSDLIAEKSVSTYGEISVGT
ncbi:quinol monooxygenase YgiN [Shimia isoporae]|uniref:Quinol monooxygenase YgiN n=1 Tax=Shimia isoporae TaxID=647720 RepID=A0A4R1NTQ0_9RHOB|nr:putative quinol monooxygenase [Shimia isoporae]TCL08382.1 quinol monooxygenase YgiN [Shimia isoporae]